MSTRWPWFLALLLPGCAMEVASDPADVEAPENQPAAVRDFQHLHHPQGPPDLCKYGEYRVIDGHTVWLPVPCVREEIDRGDPPPDREKALIDERVTPDESVGDPAEIVAPGESLSAPAAVVATPQGR